MILFEDGQYKIFSVQFPTQDVDLIGGGPTSIIAGYHANDNTYNMVWNLTNIGTDGNQFTLTNAAPTSHGAYAGVTNITVGATLHGSTTPVTWTAVGTCTAGQYWMFAPSSTGSGSSPTSGLLWNLPNGEDGTPITLQPFFGLGSVSYPLQSRDGAPSSSSFSMNPVR